MDLLPQHITLFNKRMTLAGYGCFPYECKAKDMHPNAGIYYTDDKAGWTHQYASDFKYRDQSKDVYSSVPLMDQPGPIKN
jgi:hypothetical protein